MFEGPQCTLKVSIPNFGIRFRMELGCAPNSLFLDVLV